MKRYSIISVMLITSFAMAVLIAKPTRLLAHEDFLISHNGSNLVTGGYDDSIPAIITEGPKRVYEFDVEFVSGGSPYNSPDPGIQSRPSGEMSSLMALPAGEDLAFRMMPITVGASSRNLWYWDGAGSVDFTSLSSSTVFQLSHPSSSGSSSITGTDDSIVPGFLINTVSAGPDPIHQHLETTLSTSGGEPAQGIYLASVDFELTGGLGRSEPAYLVYATVDIGGTITEEMHEAAADWVLDNLVNQKNATSESAIPEPSSALLVGCGLLVLARKRRKKSM